MARPSSAPFRFYLVTAGFRPPLAAPETFERHFGDRLWIQVSDAAAAGGSWAVPTLVARLAEARGEPLKAVMSGHVGSAHGTSAQV